jgi:hypothetical protein
LSQRRGRITSGDELKQRNGEGGLLEIFCGSSLLVSRGP